MYRSPNPPPHLEPPDAFVRYGVTWRKGDVDPTRVPKIYIPGARRRRDKTHVHNFFPKNSHTFFFSNRRKNQPLCYLHNVFTTYYNYRTLFKHFLLLFFTKKLVHSRHFCFSIWIFCSFIRLFLFFPSPLMVRKTEQSNWYLSLDFLKSPGILPSKIWSLSAYITGRANILNAHT